MPKRGEHRPRRAGDCYAPPRREPRFVSWPVEGAALKCKMSCPLCNLRSRLRRKTPPQKTLAPQAELTAEDRLQLSNKLASLRRSSERVLTRWINISPGMVQAEALDTGKGGRTKNPAGQRFPWRQWARAPLLHFWQNLRPRLFRLSFRALRPLTRRLLGRLSRSL